MGPPRKIMVQDDSGFMVPFHVAKPLHPTRGTARAFKYPKHRHSTKLLEVILRSRIKMRDFATDPQELPRWDHTLKVIYAIYIHFRLRGTFADDVKHLGLGGPEEIISLCVCVAGIGPSRAQQECIDAGSILPFVDRCISYLLQ